MYPDEELLSRLSIHVEELKAIRSGYAYQKQHARWWEIRRKAHISQVIVLLSVLINWVLTGKKGIQIKFDRNEGNEL